VQVVYALPDDQRIVDVEYRAGLTAAEAVAASGLRDAFPEISARPLVLGVFGTQVEHDHGLRPGDRVEICRPLETDPRQMRREYAASGKVMGGGREPASVSSAAAK
jgi:hypothetical protein